MTQNTQIWIIVIRLSEKKTAFQMCFQFELEISQDGLFRLATVQSWLGTSGCRRKTSGNFHDNSFICTHQFKWQTATDKRIRTKRFKISTWFYSNVLSFLKIQSMKICPRTRFEPEFIWWIKLILSIAPQKRVWTTATTLSFVCKSLWILVNL